MQGYIVCLYNSCSITLHNYRLKREIRTNFTKQPKWEDLIGLDRAGACLNTPLGNAFALLITTLHDESIQTLSSLSLDVKCHYAWKTFSGDDLASIALIRVIINAAFGSRSYVFIRFHPGRHLPELDRSYLRRWHNVFARKYILLAKRRGKRERE